MLSHRSCCTSHYFSDMTKGLFSTITSVQIFTNDRFSVSPHSSSRHVQFCKERTKWA
nr:MAG TPA: hypothetical protein [Caudoviricetes sp.]